MNEIRARGALLACLPTMLLAAAGCSSSAIPGVPVPVVEETVTEVPEEGSVFDEVAMVDGVRDLLTRSYGVSGVEEVRCPPDQAVKVGHRFQCVVVIDGEERSVTITVRTETGEFEVSTPE